MATMSSSWHCSQCELFTKCLGHLFNVNFIYSIWIADATRSISMEFLWTVHCYLMEWKTSEWHIKVTMKIMDIMELWNNFVLVWIEIQSLTWNRNRRLYREDEHCCCRTFELPKIRKLPTTWSLTFSISLKLTINVIGSSFSHQLKLDHVYH